MSLYTRVLDKIRGLNPPGYGQAYYLKMIRGASNGVELILTSYPFEGVDEILVKCPWHPQDQNASQLARHLSDRYYQKFGYHID